MNLDGENGRCRNHFSASPMRKSPFLVAAVVFGLALLPARPLPAAKPSDPAQDLDAQVEEMFKKLDANGDGYIDREEYGAKHASRFDKIDANGDGKIDRAEMKAWLEKREDRPTRPGKEIRRGRGKADEKT
jgi:EF hand